MASAWLPTRDAVLQQFAVNMSAKISAGPGVYGVSSSDAAGLASLLASYSAALAVANTPATRTKTAIVGKDVSRAALVATIRSLAKRIGANPAVTSAQKIDLGLQIKSAPSPIPPPAVAPSINLDAINIRSHTVRIGNAEAPTRRAKPKGVDGAEIYVYVPETPPTPGTPAPQPPDDLTAWRFEGLTTDPKFRITYDQADAGKTATIVARWYNPRGQPGPVSAPVTVPIAA